MTDILSDLARCLHARRVFSALCDWCGARPWTTRIDGSWFCTQQMDLVCGGCAADHLGSLVA